VSVLESKRALKEAKAAEGVEGYHLRSATGWWQASAPKKA